MRFHSAVLISLVFKGALLRERVQALSSDDCDADTQQCSSPFEPSTEEYPTGTDLGVAQTLVHPDFSFTQQQSALRIEESRQYLRTLSFDEDILKLCKNKHEHCTLWAAAQECDKNEKCEFIQSSGVLL